MKVVEGSKIFITWLSGQAISNRKVAHGHVARYIRCASWIVNSDVLPCTASHLSKDRRLAAWKNRPEAVSEDQPIQFRRWRDETRCQVSPETRVLAPAFQ